jgi:hypothetical protein
VWSSARDFDFRNHRLDWVIFILILFGLIAINQRTLISPIGWQGDEDFHIRNTLELVKRISGRQLLALYGSLILFSYFSWRKPNRVIFFSLPLATGGIILLFFNNPLEGFDPNLLLRYPFINYHFFAIAPKIATFISNPYHEFLYRIIPLLAVAATIFLFLRNLTTAN